MALTFYLLHPVSHFTYVLMIWTILLIFNWTDGHGFNLLLFTSSKSLHIHINDTNILTLFGLNHCTGQSFYHLPFTFSKLLHIRINDMNIWTLYNSSTGRSFNLLHPVSHYKYALLIWRYGLFIYSTTGPSFYLLHPVSHYKYALMIWIYGHLLDWNTVHSFYLLLFTFSKSLHICINDLKIFTLFSFKPLVMDLTFYLLHPVCHFTFASMIWTYKLFFYWTNNHFFYFFPFTSS